MALVASILGEDGETALRDRGNGDKLWSEWQVVPGEIAPDHLSAVASNAAGGISLVDLSTGDATTIDLGIGLIRGAAFDPDGDRVAVGGVDNLAIVNLERGVVAQMIGIPAVSDVHWLDEQNLVVSTNTGWSRVSLDVEDAISQVRSQVFRTFTPSECNQHRIDPCPTLEEMREG